MIYNNAFNWINYNVLFLKIYEILLWIIWIVIGYVYYILFIYIFTIINKFHKTDNFKQSHFTIINDVFKHFLMVNLLLILLNIMSNTLQIPKTCKIGKYQYSTADIVGKGYYGKVYKGFR